MLIAFSDVISILAIRQTLFARLERRIEKSLIQEVEEFRQLVREGKNPKTGEPFGSDVDGIFKLFMARNIPEDDEFLLAILDGKLERASPRAVPPPLSGDSNIIKQWAQVTQPSRGEVLTPEATILYAAEPVLVEGEVRGVFVVVHWLSGEREEVDEAVFVVIQVGIFVLAVASTLAWITAGRVLAPLSELTETAREISESDLTRRIPVQGYDEIAELSATFNEMLERLETAFANQRNFIDDVGHELRTPITIIRGYLELLGSEIPKQRETIELVTDELDRMNRFVNDLLLLAKAEQPDFLMLELVDIGLLTEEIFAKAKALGDRNWRLEGKGKGRIVADRQRITQAIVNLAQNATQHTKEGDEIALGSTLIQGKVHLWVRDTGAGISLADQKRIFERFARASASRRRPEGMGLGLAIVRAIAEAHGGSIELVSKPGAGSTFTLILPPEPPQEVFLNEPHSNC
ncbi:sensor histidine kinase [Microseira wollei]|uniref:histidine kinase n=1 Tax=Microseira wollei NIES-4236 TaxID=2530354 RepID=A0AAV3X8Q4_9CYAN|nr:ATP-binding protein [Microseira wollei]GET39197.1 two-component sensor histidine kinase [Microseira wollei NIES-4236]